MKNLFVVCFLFVTVVYGFPKDVANNSEKGMDSKTEIQGLDTAVESGLEDVLVDHHIEFASKKLDSNHKGKKKTIKKAHTDEEGEGKVWVFLVAGSDGWTNYRHQADICHAYQTIVLRGIPKENIIVMMKDDIATNDLNPYKGKIINEPNGTDVYEGVIIDYRGNDVTPDNFLKVLEGDKKAMEGIGSGRVIESTEKDTIFVNFDDHGSYGYVIFPNRQKLSAQNLSEAVHRMIEKKKFDKMLLYIETCESGSMADGLYSSNSSVLVLTAAGRFESSWACYCQESSLPCLGDAFSVSWMADLYQEFMATNKSIFEQFDAVRSSTRRSHVNIYGDYNLARLRLQDFFGKHFKARTLENSMREPVYDLVDARDVSLHWFKKMAKTYTKSAGADRYSQMVEKIEEGRDLIDHVFYKIIDAIARDGKEYDDVIEGRHAINFKTSNCYEKLINDFSDECVDIYKNSYTLRHLYTFYNLCLLEETHNRQINPEFKKAMESVCNEQTRQLSDID
ncbi:legumain [Nilaparvata lugens]|uniref:legumain n=1 Tax=Nilaparvata lugens TaxID=108931 RepID=UPI00193D55CD|nr:legumain [Nilaparvata lugens]